MKPQLFGRTSWSATSVLRAGLMPSLIAGICWAAEVPKTWDDKQLAGWSTPIATVNVSPAYFSPRQYYDAPVDNVRTYPVYHPDREPAGYWESLQKKSPEPLIELGKKRTAADWIVDGKRVFEEIDSMTTRVWSPQVIAMARSREEINRSGIPLEKDGTLAGFRWVVTGKGIALSLSDCALCHTQRLDDGTVVNGAPMNRGVAPSLLLPLIVASFNTFFHGSPGGDALYGEFGVPWVETDIHHQLKTMTPLVLEELFRGHIMGIIARPDGSPFYPSKIPDLIGIGDRKWLEHTATHRIRGTGDLMRYVALMTCCDSMDWGPHHMLTEPQHRVIYRYPDELLYALVQYLYSMQPPPNPNHFDEYAAEGQKIFVREGCASCHTPPLYTNNKLTLASGFTPPKEPPMPDLLNISVGTDPNMALKTRKGTGYYKVPSLKGLWYRRLYLHDGSVAKLEELFDPARLGGDYIPSGFKGFRVTHRAVPGHEFGLKLTPREKTNLLAFLRAL